MPTKPCHHLGPFFLNFLPQKILGYLKEFEKKIEKCKKGDEITRFDGTQDGQNRGEGGVICGMI
jgi:hypothetical protein